MGLIISQTYAKIGIETTPSNLEIKTNNAKLEIQSKRPKVNIHTEAPRVQIDQYECFASSGLKGPLDLTRDAAQRGYESALEYTGKLAEDGDRLAAIEKGGKPIVEIAVRDSNPEHEFGMVTMPAVGPKISVTGSIEIDPENTSEGVNNGVDGEFTPGEVNINFTPAKVRTYMAQYASVDIKYQDNKVDVKI
ncbi:MAG: DUF6470 family protein [Bacillota bacterium]|nr:DUF6470 family protein [Bacillota bacterium]